MPFAYLRYYSPKNKSMVHPVQVCYDLILKLSYLLKDQIFPSFGQLETTHLLNLALEKISYHTMPAQYSCHSETTSCKVLVCCSVTFVPGNLILCSETTTD